MAIVKSFRALRYNAATIKGTAADVVCPPYDVIDGAMQDALYNRNPYNVVRVEFGKTTPDDKAGHDRYTRAAHTFKEWIATNILTKESANSFYLYEQTFDIASGGASTSKVVVRRGIFGAVKLEPFGTGCVYPHEETFGAPKADRLSLMQACAANLSPIFGLFPDEDNAISKLLAQGVAMKAPAVELTEANGVVNKLWAIDDPKWSIAMSHALADKNCYIADGHHRYETSCNYRDERRAADGDAVGSLDKSYNYTLMMCVPMSDPGLYILPTHRLIQKAPGISKESFLAASHHLFEAHDATEKELLHLAEEETGPVRIGVIYKDGSRQILTMKPTVDSAMIAAQPNKSTAWRELDVSVLQELVLKGALKLSEEKVLRKEGVSYTPDTRQAISRVTAHEGAYEMGFILRPTRIDQVRDVAVGGEKMPQKSTYFYPKLLTGMVVRQLD